MLLEEDEFEFEYKADNCGSNLSVYDDYDQDDGIKDPDYDFDGVYKPTNPAKLSNDFLFRNFKCTEEPSQEGDYFYNFKSKLACEKHMNTTIKGQYARIPHFISYASGRDNRFSILCTRPVTTTELLETFKSTEHTTSTINEFREQSKTFDFTSDSTKLRRSQNTIRRLQEKFNVEFSKAEPDCGSCIGKREEGLHEAAKESSHHALHIVKESDNWEKKTPLSRFRKNECLNEWQNHITAQRRDQMTHHSERKDNEVRMMEFLIPPAAEVVSEEGADDVLLVVFPKTSSLLQIETDLEQQRWNVINRGRGISDYVDYSNCTKLYVGDIKYLKVREQQDTDLIMKETFAEECEKSFVTRKMEEVEQWGNSPIVDLKEHLEKLNKDKDWIKHGERISQSNDMTLYIDYIEGSPYLTYCTRQLNAYELEKMILSNPKVKTMDEVNEFCYKDQNGRTCSSSFIIDPDYNIETVVEAYDRYMKFVKKNQCSSCHHLINNEPDLLDENEVYEHQQFSNDFKFIQRATLAFRSEYDSGMIVANQESFLHSVASYDGKFNYSELESKSLHIIELPTQGQEVNDVMFVLTSDREFDLSMLLRGLKEQVISDSFREKADGESSVYPIINVHVGAGELFEQEVYELCHVGTD